LLPRGVFKNSTEQITEANDHANGSLVAAFADQAGDGVECVEEKVGLDLLAQSAELGFRKLLIQTGCLSVLLGQALPDSSTELTIKMVA